MLDWNQIKSKVSEVYDATSKKIRQYTPESFSPEKKFVNGVVISLALMTMADKKVETQEVVASMDMLKEIDQIRELDMLQDAIELYEMHIETLEKAVQNDAKWTIAVAKLLSELGKVKQYPEYATMIKNLLDYIAMADGNLDPLETQMKNKILEALE